MADLEEKHVEKERRLKQLMEEKMRLQREEAEAAIAAARKQSAAEKQRHLRQQRDLQGRIDQAKKRQAEQQRVINDLRQKFRKM